MHFGRRRVGLASEETGEYTLPVKTSDDLKSRILALLNDADAGGLRRSDLKRVLKCTSGRGQQEFREAFRELMKRGLVLRKRGGRYVVSSQTVLRPGVISVNPRGFAFVCLDDAETAPDVFIPPKHVGEAISGDRVLIEVMDNHDERGPSGRVVKVTERRHRSFVGCLAENGGVIGVRPLRRELPEFIPLTYPIPEDISRGVYEGDWVRAAFCPRDGMETALQCSIVERLGTGRSVTADLDAIADEFGLPSPYSEAENAAARELVPLSIERRDLRELCTVTIDPPDAKDFDDALSMSPGVETGTVIVGVHIADVAVYVSSGSELDVEARKRGFTAYLPGRTLPMLPRILSADLCSLREGQDRLAHSLLLTIRRSDGIVLRSERCHSFIRVRQRLTFGAVHDFLTEGKAQGGLLNEPVAECLRELGALARTMRRCRADAEHFLDLALPEVRVLASEDPPRVTGLSRVNASAAHQLVEEFMLAANVAVADELVTREIPAVFRNHGDPRPGDLEEFVTWASFVLGGRKVRIGDRERMNGLIAETAESPAKDIILTSFLRVLPRATYGNVCNGHFGLGKDRYCHFTSPIRRYPDLLIHQQLLAMDLSRPPVNGTECENLGMGCTEAEERIDTAFYAAVDRLKLRFLRDRQLRDPGQIYEGVVFRVSTDGVLVYLRDIALIGRLPIHSLGPGRSTLSRNGMALENRGSGKITSCGDVIYTQIRSADTVRGVLELKPVQVRV